MNSKAKKLVADNQTPQTFIERFNAVQKIGIDTKVPWEVMRVTGIERLSIMGDQVCIGSQDSDYVSLEEARLALQILVNELGGEVKWQN